MYFSLLFCWLLAVCDTLAATTLTYDGTDLNSNRINYVQPGYTFSTDTDTSITLWAARTNVTVWTSDLVHSPQLQHGAQYTAQAGHSTFQLHVTPNWDVAQWIASPEEVTSYFRIAWDQPNKKLLSATAFMSGLGWSRLYINGRDVFEDRNLALAPGWTRFDRHAPYIALDVTDEITPQQGKLSVLGVLLGLGWRDRFWFYPLDVDFKPSKERCLRIIVQMVFTDSTTQQIVSSTNGWFTTPSPVLYDSVYNGETYDQNKEIPGWDTPGYNWELKGNNWKPVIATNGPTNIMYLQPMKPIIAGKRLAAIDVYRLDSTRQIVDFGENSAGWCTLRVPKNSQIGTAIALHHAEVPLHEPYGPRNKSLYFDNNGLAKATDTFITANRTTDVWVHPHFTYHGFRYVQVSNYPRDITKDDIVKVRLHTNVTRNVEFSSSSYIFNTLFDMLIVAQRSNLMSIPTDCDQRDERLGWMGDAGLSSNTFMWTWEIKNFLHNYLTIIHDEQDKLTGSLPDVVPYYRYGSRPADASWSATFTQLQWTLLKYYNDVEVVGKYFQASLLYIQDLVSRVPPPEKGGIGKFPGIYGDWYPPPPQPRITNHFTASWSFLMSLKQVIEFADVLNKTKEKQQLQATLKSLATQWNSYFYNRTTNTYLKGEQTSLSLPLVSGVCEFSEHVDCGAIAQQLASSMLQTNYHLTSGILGTKATLQALWMYGYYDSVFQIIEQVDYPSWGLFRFNNLEPATGLWERWNTPWHGPDPEDNSRNHHMYGTFGQYLVEYMAGLTINTTLPDQPVSFRPSKVLGLTSGSINLHYPYDIQYSWERRGGTGRCAKMPEGKSTLKPYLPETVDMEIGCGLGGGVISEIAFAELGQPQGLCGNLKHNPLCFNSRVPPIVRRQCLDKSTCSIPVNADVWGNITCPPTNKTTHDGTVIPVTFPDEIPDTSNLHWLSVEYSCSATIRLSVNISMENVNGGFVHLPTNHFGHIKWITIKNFDTTIWANGKNIPQPPSSGIVSVTEVGEDLVVQLWSAGGHSVSYSFIMFATR